MWLVSIFVLLVISAGGARSSPLDSPSYSSIVSASIDADGQVVMRLADGSAQQGVREAWQSGVADLKIAPDRRTIGWLVLSNNPDPNRRWEQLPGELIVLRGGRVLRRFRPQQFIYSWNFVDGSSQVAWHEGPLHGDRLNLCQLRDLSTGKLLAAWDASMKKALPGWVSALHDPSL